MRMVLNHNVAPKDAAYERDDAFICTYQGGSYVTNMSLITLSLLLLHWMLSYGYIRVKKTSSSSRYSFFNV